LIVRLLAPSSRRLAVGDSEARSDTASSVHPVGGTALQRTFLNNWTLIVSNWKASKEFPSRDKDALFGAFDYTPDKDVMRAPMKLETLSHSVDQLTWTFLDMSHAGGALAIEWDKVLASVPFRIG
jgi:hypothetical protein